MYFKLLKIPHNLSLYNTVKIQNRLISMDLYLYNNLKYSNFKVSAKWTQCIFLIHLNTDLSEKVIIFT